MGMILFQPTFKLKFCRVYFVEFSMAAESHKIKERWSRSLVKTVTYRIVIIILDFTSIYLLTGKYDTALWFMLVSNVYTSIAYYIHERFWNRTSWGINS